MVISIDNDVDYIDYGGVNQQQVGNTPLSGRCQKNINS